MPLVPCSPRCSRRNPAPDRRPPNAALIGQWESAVRTPEGVGNILEFYPDGRVTQISASMAEADYRLVGDRLVTTWKDLATGKISEVETQVEFEGDATGFSRSPTTTPATRGPIGSAPRRARARRWSAGGASSFSRR